MVTVDEIQIIPIKPQSGLIAFASCVLDGKWYLANIAIYTRLGGGYRLVYPTRKVGADNFPIFYPINKVVGEKVEEVITKKIDELWNKSMNK